jgi:DNA polymerase V
MVRELEIPKNLSNTNRLTNNYNIIDTGYQNGIITKRIITDPQNTRYFEADNDEMRYFGIKKGSLIIVNKAINPVSGMLIACWVETEFLIRKLCVKGNHQFLCVNNAMDGCINITGREIEICGVVTWTCLPHNLREQ